MNGVSLFEERQIEAVHNAISKRAAALRSSFWLDVLAYSGETNLIVLGQSLPEQALCIVICNVVDLRAHGIVVHGPSIVRLYYKRSHAASTFVIPGSQPQIVIVGVENDRHAVMNSSGHRIRRRSQNRAGLDRRFSRSCL